jgi:precorrin-2/cobalt-factor-2 C20-methyltransferase
MTGTLFALGVGPGDPDLLTLRARAILERVPTVFATSRRASDRSYALGLVSAYLDPSRQRTAVLPFPTSDLGWADHTRTLVAELAHGDAAFVTEGDPLLYSSFIGILGCLRATYPEVAVEVVPGVASPMAAAAAAGLPLADDDQRLAILPAMYALNVLPDILRCFDSLVLLKVSAVLGPVLDCLEAAGRGPSVVYVRRVGRPEQTLLVGAAAIRAAPPEVTADYFSLLVVPAA